MNTNVDHMEHHKNCGGSHHEMMITDFKKRFWVSLILTIPILILSPMIQMLLHYNLNFRGDLYLLWGLSTFLFFYGGWPFLKGGFVELSKKNPGMMTLIAMAIIIAYVYSAAVVLGLKGKIFFWELVTLIDIMLLGHWIEMKSVLGASRSLEFLIKMMPSTAFLIVNDQVKEVKIEELKVDDIVLVKPGAKVPVDGIVIEGVGYLNESMLTGESKPVKKEKNSKVIAGSINGNSSLKVKILHLGKDSYLAKVIKLVDDAQKEKSKTQRLADISARWLTFIALFAGIVTFILWMLIKVDLGFSLERMVTVMVISCPHALGLAIPLVIAVSTTMSAKSGLLIRNRTAFENSRKITTVVFDKTGTLTEGKFGVKEYQSISDKYSAEDILQLAASIEKYSEHPIGHAIFQIASEKKINLFEVKNFKNLTGEGIEGEVNNKFIQIVSPSFLQKNNISLENGIPITEDSTTVCLLIDKKVEGYISLQDAIRPESYKVVEELKKMHIKTMMITGDNEKVAKEVSLKLGLDSFHANILPDQKLNIIKELQQKGEFVAMTGDGVNDAPALAQADIGIAIGSGTDIAAETSDIILVESNPQDILALILFGKATYRKMVQNLIWATAYNAVAIPLAAGALYEYNIIISPAIGAVLMSLSTIIVAFNARLLQMNKGLRLIQKKR